MSVGRGLVTCQLSRGIDPFHKIPGTLNNAEIPVGNLESVISDSSVLDGYRIHVFRAPIIVARMRRKACFSVRSVANNHTIDHGPDAFFDIYRNLQRNVLRYCGTEKDPVCVSVHPRNGEKFKVAIIGASFHPNRMRFNPLHSHVRDDEGLSEIADNVSLASENSDFVVVQCHWGNKSVTLPSPEQSRTAKRLIESGADVIIGHHPHVYQGLVVINGMPVYFSLGNFISDMMRDYPRFGAIGCVHLSNVSDSKSVRGASIPVHIYRTNQPKVFRISRDVDTIGKTDDIAAFWEHSGVPLLYQSRRRKAAAKHRRDSSHTSLIRLNYAQD